MVALGKGQKLHVYAYRLPLRATSGGVRDGLLVAVRRSDGAVAWGEVAPLPGFSQETLHESKEELLSICAGRRDFSDTLASVRCGLEQVGRGLRGGGTAKPLRDHITLSALLSQGGAVDVKRAEACRAAGFTSVKLKVGRQMVGADIAFAHRVRAALGSNVDLRVDANRAWSLDEAAAFAKGVRDIGIAYIEEPLADPEGLEEFACFCAVPVALDESLTGKNPAWLQRRSYVHTIVLKPMILGGYTCALAWAREAERLGMDAVLSSAYETGVGMSGLVELAAHMPRDTGAGLGTYHLLESDVVHPRLELNVSSISVGATTLIGRQINLQALAIVQCP